VYEIDFRFALARETLFDYISFNDVAARLIFQY